MEKEFTDEDLERKYTLFELWSSTFIVHQDLIQIDSSLIMGNKDNPFLRKKVLYYSMLSASALLLSIYKDKLLYKSGTMLKSTIDDLTFRNLVGRIITIKKKKAFIGDIEFNNYLDAFNFLRNKILHGEYTLDDESIILKKDGKTGKVNVSKFTDIVLQLQEIMEAEDKSTKRRIVTFKSDYKHDSICDKINNDELELVEIEVVKSGKRKITPSDMKIVDDYIKILNTIVANYKCDVNEAEFWFERIYPSQYNQIMNNLTNRKIKLDYIFFDITEEPRYKFVKELLFDKNHMFYKKLKSNDRLFVPSILQIMSDNLEDEKEAGYKLTNISLKNYIKMLVEAIKNPKKGSFLELDNRYTTYNDDLIIASVFNCFYGKYHYGLDEIYSYGRLSNLKEILSGKKIDFSEMDLSLFDDPDMDIDIELNDYYPQEAAIRKEFINTLNAFVDIEKQYLNTKDNMKIPEKNRELIKKNYLLAKEKRDNEMELIKRLDSFDVKTFERKLNIMNHIRNAFAHGGVTILPYETGESLLDRKILIVDEFEGKVTYKKEITYKDFHSLFTYEHNKMFKDFIEENVDSKTRTEINVGSREEVGDQHNVIVSSKKEEWDRLLDDYKLAGNEQEVRYMQLAYYQMMTVNDSLFDKNVEEITQNIQLYIDYLFSEQDNNQITVLSNKEECFNKVWNYYVLFYKDVPEDLRNIVGNNQNNVNNKNFVSDTLLSYKKTTKSKKTY